MSKFYNNTPKKNYTTKAYKITLRSANGNDVAYINLHSQFLKTAIDKQPEYITLADVLAINNGDLISYLKSCTIEVEATQSQSNTKPTSIANY